MNEHGHRFSAWLSAASAGAGLYNWLVSHGPTLISVAGGIGALLAAAYSIQASRATTRLRNRQIKQLEKD